MKITCLPVKKVFPFQPEDELEFCIVLYKPTDANIQIPALVDGCFKAKGRLLPYWEKCEVILEGDWDTKKEPIFSVSDYVVKFPTDLADLRDSLVSFPFLGKIAATGLVNDLRNNCIEGLNKDPSLIGKYVRPAYASRAIDAYNLRMPKRELVSYLAQHKVRGAEQLAKLALSIPSVSALRATPFLFCVKTDVSLSLAKRIAKEEGIPIETVDGAMASIIDVLKKSEGSAQDRENMDEESVTGNTYCEVEQLISKAASQIGVLFSEPIMRDALNRLISDEVIFLDDGNYVYRKQTADAEFGIARELLRINSAEISNDDYRNDIAEFEIQSHLRLAPEQREAVKTALSNPLTLLIGGPGTGKTTIERVIIKIFRKFHRSNVLLVAPTGKAAVRMSESTGEPAFTIHKALGVVAGSEVLQSDEILDAGLVIIDEASMLGSQESIALFRAIPTGTQVVIVGDTNQLPSVGAGNVLFELIRSKVFATVQLVTVYRQKEGSTIAINCARIKRGKTDLQYEAGIFEQSIVSGEKAAVDEVLSAFKDALESGVSIDDICVLSPYRQSTPTGTDQLNAKIQELVNNKSGIPCITYGKRKIYLHDKVMFKANKDNAVNGDIGKVTEINGAKFTVDYGDGRKITYSKSSMRDFDLAFSITIHKSQGAEFPFCIIVMMNDHKTMLKRNLLYTAVSRAKQKVLLVGQPSAINKAILTEDVSVRQSRLADIIQRQVQA